MWLSDRNMVKASKTSYIGHCKFPSSHIKKKWKIGVIYFYILIWFNRLKIVSFPCVTDIKIIHDILYLMFLLGCWNLLCIVRWEFMSTWTKHVPKAPWPHGNRSPCCRERVQKNLQNVLLIERQNIPDGSTQCFLECELRSPLWEWSGA